jgi:hypothetical protein
MKLKRKIIAIAIVVMAIAGFAGYNYVMHGGARNLSNEDAAYTVSSKSITTEFSSNVDTANKKYLEKAIIIKGTVTKITGKEIIIDDTIICNLKELDPTIQKDQTITLKGRVVGYDDLMGEIKLDQCLKVS